MKSTIATALLLLSTAAAAFASTDTLITSTDIVGTDFPLWVQSDTTSMTWGHNPGNTEGRMLRLQDVQPGNRTFYDIGIGGSDDYNNNHNNNPYNFFITKVGSYTHEFEINSSGVSITDALAVGGSATTGGNATVGGSLTVGGSVTLNLPTATTTLKQVLYDPSTGKLYVEP